MFNDLVRHVTGEGESSGVGVDFHSSTKGLLSTGCHSFSTISVYKEPIELQLHIRICFIENDDFVSSRWEGDLSLSERLYLVSDYVDTSVPTSIFTLDQLDLTHRSSDAFSSSTPSLYASPRSACARQCIEVVFPIPGIPEMMICGTLPSSAMTFNRSMVSELPTISSKRTGRYFSTLLNCY